MATYLLFHGCGEEEEKEEEEEDTGGDVRSEDRTRPTGAKSIVSVTTGLSGCGGGGKAEKVTEKKPLCEDDLRQLLSRQVEEARLKERATRGNGLADGRLAYLQKTHYGSAWRETGVIPPRGQRGDDGDFHGGQNIGSRTSIAGLNYYVPPIVDLPMRAVAYLEEHKIIYLLEEILTEMLVRRPTSPRRYLLDWLRRVRGPIETLPQESPLSSGTLCSSCCRLTGDVKISASDVKTRIELCDCQESYEDLRTEAEKRRGVKLTPKLVDPQQWMWEEVEEEKKRDEEERDEEEDEDEEENEEEEDGTGDNSEQESREPKEDEIDEDEIDEEIQNGETKDVESKGETEGESKGETEGESKGETEGESKGETEGETEGESKGVTEGESKGETEGEFNGEAEVETKGQIEREPKSEIETQGDTAGETRGETEGETEVVGAKGPKEVIEENRKEGKNPGEENRDEGLDEGEQEPEGDAERGKGVREGGERDDNGGSEEENAGVIIAAEETGESNDAEGKVDGNREGEAEEASEDADDGAKEEKAAEADAGTDVES